MRDTSHVDTFTAANEPADDLWPDISNASGLVNYPASLNASVALLGEDQPRFDGDKTAVIASDGTWSYESLLRSVTATASLLRRLGVQPGNRVLLRGLNTGWLTIAWLACLRVGAVAVTTVPLLRMRELDEICDIAQPSLAIVDHRLTDEWSKVDFPGETLVFGDGSPGSLESLVNDVDDDSCSHPTLAADTAILAFTSGTTGRPKATMHSHRDLLAICDTYAAHILKPGPEDVFAGTPPLAFTFGLGGLLVFPLAFGATTVLLDKPDPTSLLAAIEGNEVTCLFTAPTGYRAMLREIDGYDTSSLRCCVSAGEALAQATSDDWFDKTGLRLIDGIGSTEMLHIFISNSVDEWRPGTLGRVVPGYSAMVVDEDMVRVPPNTPGQLAVKGVTGCRYLNDPRQMNYVRDGWNVTGDIFTESEDGFFRYVARSDDMIVSSGYNIAAPEVENALVTHPSVQEVAVVGMPDDERGNIVTAFIVPTADTTVDSSLAQTLQEHVKNEIAPYKYPRRIEFVDALPKTGSGKLQRSRLRDHPAANTKPNNGSARK